MDELIARQQHRERLERAERQMRRLPGLTEEFGRGTGSSLGLASTERSVPRHVLAGMLRTLADRIEPAEPRWA